VKELDCNVIFFIPQAQKFSFVDAELTAVPGWDFPVRHSWLMAASSLQPTSV
jgi:hypothetical protein